MKWRHVLIVAFWMVVLTLLAKSWMATHVVTTPDPEIAKEAELEAAANAPRVTGPIIMVHSYTIEKIDAYHFNVHFKVYNTGDRAAKNISIRLEPWNHGTVPGNDDKEIDDDLPIKSSGKTDVIESIGPGEIIERIVPFDGVDYANPALVQAQESFHIQFDK